jgi:hypothetical protein
MSSKSCSIVQGRFAVWTYFGNGEDAPYPVIADGEGYYFGRSYEMYPTEYDDRTIGHAIRFAWSAESVTRVEVRVLVRR